MKILQVCSASEMGGGEVHVVDLVKALAARGHAMHLAVRPASPLREALSGTQVFWHEAPLRNSLDIKSARIIADAVASEGIDIVHAHLGRDYLVSAMACKRARRARLVLTRHHYLPVKQNPIYRWLLQDTGAVIAVSASVAASISERLDLDRSRVHVIPNWIDPLRFNPVDRAGARSALKIKGALAVACIGQVTPAKGQEEFIRAAGRIAARRGDVEFLVVGPDKDDSGDFTAHLRGLAKELGISDRVTFRGFINDIPQLMAAVDVVVVPSWDEGFSMVTIEAMAARRAVIASDVGGIRDIVQDSVTGMLFPARDVGSLANKLLWVLSDSPLRDRLGAQGQRDVYARFSRDNIIDRIEQLYQTLAPAGPRLA